ncbi:MAG: hypothetical protein JST86_09850 [Bacteroidetes bacterium]|nr:hypothetical protein [Bacteroidota bacterium]
MKININFFNTIIILLFSCLTLKSSAQTGKYTFAAIYTQPALIPAANGKIVLSGVEAKPPFTISDSAKKVVLPQNDNRFQFNAQNKTLTIDLSSVDAKNYPLWLNTTKNSKPFSVKITNATASGGNAGPDIVGRVNGSNQPDQITGIAFWDADVIYKKLKAADLKPLPDENKKIILSIINQYAAKPYTDFNALSTSNNYFKKVNAFTAQPGEFLNGPLDSLTKYKKTAAGVQDAGEQTATKSITGILGSLSGIDVTKYVQAFADFLRDRIKEELTVAYINKLKNWLNTYPELQYLLPKTWDVFSNNDIYNAPSMGPVYKAAFSQDLAGLAENFETMVFSMPKYDSLKNNNGFVAFMFAYHYADLNAKGYHPADILHRINNRLGYTDDTNSTVSYLISTLTMFSDNLVDTTSEGWIKKEHLNLVNKDFMNIFFGLLKEKYQPLFAHQTGKFTLDNLLDNTSDAAGKLMDILAVVKTLDKRIQEFSAMNAGDKQKNAVGFFANNADAIMDMVETTATLLKLPEKTTAQYQKWKTIIGDAVDVAKALRDTTSNGIGNVAINSLAIIAEFIKKDNIALFEKITEFTKFISDMAVAKSAADVKTVITKYAAPPHSYLVNRSSKVTFSLASYAGLYLGLERNKAVKNGKFNDNSVGVTAPIGLAVNMGTAKKGSWGFFLSMVDIGAALSYRWNNDTADIPSKITLGQVFAPGVHVVYGLPNSPLTIKAGYQLAPQLRKIKTDQNTINDQGDVWRLSVGLSVDIPVFVFSFKKKDDTVAHAGKKSQTGTQ